MTALDPPPPPNPKSQGFCGNVEESAVVLKEEKALPRFRAEWAPEVKSSWECAAGGALGSRECVAGAEGRS